VMANSVISISLDLSVDSVGILAGRVILFGTISTTILDTALSMIPSTTYIDTTMIPTEIPTISSIVPSSPDYTPASPNYTPASPDYLPTSDTESDPSKNPSSDHIPPLPATSPFLSLTDDSSYSDIPDTPLSPTHGTPFTETTLSTQSSPATSGALHRQVMILDDSLRDSSSSSSLETSSNYSTDALSNSTSSRSSSDHSLPASPSSTRSSHHLCSLVPSILRSSTAIFERPSHSSSSVSPSRKRSRSPAASVLLSSPVLEALSYVHADLLPPPKRIKSSDDLIDLEVSLVESSKQSRSRGTDLEVDVDVERSDKPHLEPKIDPVEAVIEECFDFADIIRGSEVNVRVEVVIIARDEIKMSARGTVVVSDDRDTPPIVLKVIPNPTQEGA
ncbi:hypothetical protein Tco_1190850, partial [Tanacetum coccineum]